MKVALAQVNSWLGDFSGNAEKILSCCRQAAREGAELVVFPEAALFGYHPCDLLEREQIVLNQVKQVQSLSRKIPKGIGVFVGAIGLNPGEGKPYQNCAVFLEKGQKPKWFAKELLPTYDVFDEARHIQPGRIEKNILNWKRKRILVTICEDIWGWPMAGKPRFAKYPSNPLKNVKGKIDLVINLSASPFTHTKMSQRQKVTSSTAKYFKAPMVYVNMVGAQDELIFDGASLALNSKGKEIARCNRFAEDLRVIDFKGKNTNYKVDEVEIEVLRRALVLGLRDFVRKNGFSRVHLGLSGGIDSALVACLAADAVGAENVLAVGMPGPYSDPKSLEVAREMAKNLGLSWKEIPIAQQYETFKGELEKATGSFAFSVAHENLQARLRALVLMWVANQEKSLLLATSNKSELATGYSTLYGDMCGAVMPIGDLLKGEVYELARHYNRQREHIPKFVLERPPSAELRPNQRDQDSLPPYDELDRVVVNLVESFAPAKSGLNQRVLNMMMGSEFKRWQAPPILKVSNHAFGRGRRLPLAHLARG